MLDFISLDPHRALALHFLPRYFVRVGCRQGHKDSFDVTELFGLKESEVGNANLGPVSLGTEQNKIKSMFNCKWGITSRTMILFDEDDNGISTPACMQPPQEGIAII